MKSGKYSHTTVTHHQMTGMNLLQLLPENPKKLKQHPSKGFDLHGTRKSSSVAKYIFSLLRASQHL